jgi:ubiquitin carboxyl-terminal hydrolase 34
VATFLPEAERPVSNISDDYFSDGVALVDRLVKFVLVMLDVPNFVAAAQDAYAAILEASLHSRAVWIAFTRHPESHQMHQSLLLAQPIQPIREHVGRKIASICGGHLPSTCPISKAETAAHFWSIISAILPASVQYSGQSQQLFEIAEHVFRTNDEYDRNEQHLRSLLSQWSTILLDYEHKECPGREETDYVVLGLTKLLLCCTLSIKSFKKPVNAGSLMTEVFKKYLFVIRYVIFLVNRALEFVKLHGCLMRCEMLCAYPLYSPTNKT